MCLYVLQYWSSDNHTVQLTDLFRLLAGGGGSLAVRMWGTVVVTVAQVKVRLVERIPTVALAAG